MKFSIQHFLGELDIIFNNGLKYQISNHNYRGFSMATVMARFHLKASYIILYKLEKQFV